MNTIDLIRSNLARSRDRLLARIDDMRDHAFVFPTPRGGCHTLWVLGHVAYIEALVVQTFLRGEENPLAGWEAIFDGPDVSGDPAVFPPFDAVLAQLLATRQDTLALVDTLTEADLDRAGARCPASHADTFGTYRLGLQYVADHTYMHRGHLADARRAAGLERMWV